MIDLLTSLDPVMFAREDLDFEPDPWQQQVLRSESKRMIFNCCRQSGKSTTAAIKASHRALFYANQLVLILSPSLRQSGEMFRKISAIEQMVKVKPKKVEDSKLFMALDNGSRVISLPGKEGTVRGYSGVNLIIIDEDAQVDDDMYRAIRPMLAVSEGTLLLLSTPRGKRGHFFYEWHEGGDTWERVEVTANDCPRINKQFLEEERRTLGERWYRQEYECSFEEMEDGVMSYDAITAAITDDVEPLFSSPVSEDVRPLFERRGE